MVSRTFSEKLKRKKKKIKILKALPVIVLVAVFGFYFVTAVSYITRPTAYLAEIENPKKYGEIKNKDDAKYNAIIRLKSKGEKKDDFFCSGFVIDGQYAITAAHCVDSFAAEDVIRVYDEDDTFGVDAKVLGYNHRNDSAVIMGDFSNFKAVEIEKDRHGFMGSNGPFLTCGFPYGQVKIYCSYALPVKTENFSMKLIGALIPGMSGGPVFDLNTGKAVGLNTAVDKEFIVVNPIVGVLGSFGIDK